MKEMNDTQKLFAFIAIAVGASFVFKLGLFKK
jgi:hypothetical protein